MARFSLLLLLVCSLMARADDWKGFRLDQIEVLSASGEREAKEALNFLEQLRYAVGSQLGDQDIQSTWPIRVIVAGKRSPAFPSLQMGRDAWVATIHEPGPEIASSVTQALLDSWPGGLPPGIERGLVTLYSTIQIDGTRVTLGAVPPQKDRDWTRAHMLAVDPNYSGKLRVLLGNLGRGIERDVAYRNSFGQTAADIERKVDAYMAAGQYGTIPAPSRPISVRQFLGKPLDDVAGQLATADVLLANRQPGAQAIYEAVLKARPDSVEAKEGLGLIAVAAGDKDTARNLLAGSKSARPLVEYARLIEDVSAKRTALKKAAEANPKWAEPYKMLAAIETHPAQKLAALRTVAKLEPQIAQNWVELAALQEEVNQLAEAAKSWAAAEKSAQDPTEREEIRRKRVAGQQKRDAAIRAAREEERRKAEQEIADLRNRALMEIRKAEARANEGKPVIDASQLDEYKEGPAYEKVAGVLQRVDCLGQHARLHIASGKKVTRILVPDPTKVAISGGGERSFGCGVQKPARKVTIEFLPRNDPQRGTTGDAVTIEFQ